MLRRRRRVRATARQFSAAELGRKGLAVSRATGLYAVEISVRGVKEGLLCVFSANRSIRGTELVLKPVRFREGVLRGVVHVPKGEVKWGIYVDDQLVAEGGLMVRVVDAELQNEKVRLGMGGVGEGVVKFWFEEDSVFSVRAVMVEMADNGRLVRLKRGVHGWKGFGRVGGGWFRFRVMGETGMRKGAMMGVTEIGWDIGASSEWGMVTHWCKMVDGDIEVVKAEQGGTAWGGEADKVRERVAETNDGGWKREEDAGLGEGQKAEEVKLGEDRDRDYCCDENNASSTVQPSSPSTHNDAENVVPVSVACQSQPLPPSRNSIVLESMTAVMRRSNPAVEELIAEVLVTVEMGRSSKQAPASSPKLSTEEACGASSENCLLHCNWPSDDDIVPGPLSRRTTGPLVFPSASRTPQAHSSGTHITPPLHTESEITSASDSSKRRYESTLSSRQPSPYVLSDRSGNSSPLSASLSNEQQKSPRIFQKTAQIISTLRSRSRTSKTSTNRTKDTPASVGRTPPFTDNETNEESLPEAELVQRRVAEGRIWTGRGYRNRSPRKTQAFGTEEEQFARGIDDRNRRVKDVLIEVGKVLAVALLTLAAERLFSRRGGDSRRPSVDGNYGAGRTE